MVAVVKVARADWIARIFHFSEEARSMSPDNPSASSFGAPARGSLFEPVHLGPRMLANRVAMAPRTRCPARTGIHLSPASTVNGSESDGDPLRTYRYVVERLDAPGLAYIHIIEGVTQGPREVPGGFDYASLRKAFRGRYIANNGYDRRLAIEACEQGRANVLALHRES
jgi:2,4-dienoyl-CoA reductase-like NADH-dependent reductase (Old Yellow Enzyme family)